MASFTINGLDTTAEILAAGEFGIITQNGALAVNAGTAISITGDGVRLVVDGSVYSSAMAISSNAAGGYFSITGTLTSALEVMNFNYTDGASNQTILNSGVIRGVNEGADGMLIQSGGNSIVNYGEITGVGDDAIDINDSFQPGTLSNSIVNHGLIATVNFVAAISTDSGLDTVTNYGVISGGVILGGGADVYDGRGGGVVYGTVNGEGGEDMLWGGEGRDDLAGGAGADFLDGGAGEDFLRYDGSSDVTVDLLSGTASGSHADGDLFINFEHVVGGNGNDLLLGDAAGNELWGASGADTIYGRGGNDVIYGGDGNDHMYGGLGADAFIGGAGIDFVRYEESGSGVRVHLQSPHVNLGAEAAGDGYFQVEGVVGSNFADFIAGEGGANELYGLLGDDEIYGLGGDDQLFGGEGADQLEGGAGADFLDGGAGFDFARHDLAEAGVTAHLQSSFVNTGDAAGDVYSSIEGLVGSAYDDFLAGDAGNNIIYGGAGDDDIYGLGGTDQLYGEAGADVFIFLAADSLPGAQDTIRDFETGVDKIDFTALGGGAAPAFFDLGGGFTQINFDAGNNGSIDASVIVFGAVDAGDVLI